MISSDPGSSSISLCTPDDSPGSLPEVLSPQRASNSSQGVFPLPSSLANVLEETTDSEPEEEADRKSCEDSGSESEKEERSEHEDAHRLDNVDDEDNDDGDEDKGYDEVVVKPRPLNEVTSLTDKTSPWTSVLSDLDMVSLESVEETNKANLNPADGEKLQILNQQTSDCGEQNRCDTRDANRFAGCGDEKTGQTEEKESESHSDLSHEKSLSPQKQEGTANHYFPSPQDKQPQTYPYCVFAAVVWAGFFFRIYL